MKKPDLPANEVSRIETLHALNILDTPPEECFDRITRLARRMFHVPIALVSLIDTNRQWFKSSAGLDAREPHVRFYAGCPLEAPNGARLGTLCIVDRKPRILDAEDLAALRDLAAIVEDEFAAMQLAMQDDLTRISNRRGFLLTAQQSLALCMRHDMPASLVYIDLDGFKAINDTWGHAEGNLALLTFADQLQKSFRESDIFARVGGDEFAVFLANVTGDQARLIFARFTEELKKHTQELARGYDISYSHGIIEFRPGKHDSIDDLLADGDSLMYELKRVRRRA